MATHENGISVDAAVSPDEMDLMLERAQKRRGAMGGALIDESEVPIFAEIAQAFAKSETETEEESLAELPVISQNTDSEELKDPLGPIQVIKRESIIKKGVKTPLEKFRQIANQVKNNLKWAKVLDESKEEVQRSFHVEDQDGQVQKLTFDVNAFKANVQTNALPPAATIILRKNPWERSSDDLAYVIPYVVRLKCFEKYSVPIKKELACVLHYESFEDGRVIVRQGHPGLSFYVILSGTVTAEVTEMDKHTGDYHSQYVGQFLAGASFGELALLNGTKRTATIICKGDSEFLRLDKTDFDMVLRRSYQVEWDARMNSLRSLEVFGDWDEDELKSANDRARVVSYQPNTLIIGDIKIQPDNIYFIKFGKCKVVRQITLIQTQLPSGLVSYSLPCTANKARRSPNKRNVNEPIKLDKYQKMIQKFLHVATFKGGHFFGVGENLQRTHIISIGRVDCILVSRVSFLRHQRGRCLEPMRKTVMSLIPTNEAAFESFLESKKWRAYKRGLVKELVAKRHISNTTTLADVPLISRRDKRQ